MMCWRFKSSATRMLSVYVYHQEPKKIVKDAIVLGGLLVLQGLRFSKVR